MSITGVSGLSKNYLSDTPETKKSDANKETTENTTAEKTAGKDTAVDKKKEDPAVYDNSSDNTYKANGRQNTALVNQMKADLEHRKSQLQSMVEKMLTKQGQSYEKGMDIYQVLRNSSLTVDPETAAKAKADIAEDGYWGVEQTSDRMVSFAKALAGNDASKADKMMEAFKKGFEDATKSWGDKLPDLCQKTYDATLKKFDDWKNSTEKSTGTSKTES